MRAGGRTAGGEGALIADSHGYWRATLFATTGRPMPHPMPLYSLWTVIWVGICMRCRLDADGEPTIVLELEVINMVGAALQFLVVLRSNAAYARWVEGRQIWAAIIANCRNLVCFAIANLADASRVDALARHAVAYAVLCKQHLRAEHSPAELLPILSRAEVAKLFANEHAALAALELISHQLAGARRARLLDSYATMQLDDMLSELTHALTSGERILNTRMPFGYVVHLRTFLAVWLLTLPCGLVGDLGWASAPVAIGIAYVLLGVERISLDIEQPFGTDHSDLALDEFVHGVTAVDLHEMLSRHAEEHASHSLPVPLARVLGGRERSHVAARRGLDASHAATPKKPTR
ncbi:hypothetical protein KFE25_004886 [Diacronema lutheri]|uniref:Bestrophin homolog n=2 Tax=Diacronema lutheri TaxID=2081491 RepID=A0A8J5XQ27_DIALT|nr:hypothetical protein KFE25_004886 [Diacronema lutheri]